MGLHQSPYMRDTNERAGKTLTYTFASFLLQDWISSLIHLDMIERAGVAALSAAIVSFGGSYLSRFIGQRDTASLTRTYAYGDEVPEPNKHPESR